MQRHLTLTLATMMVLGTIALNAKAQVFGSQQVRARIPFAFNVGKKTLPAGEYVIAVLNPASDRKVLQIRSTDGRLTAIIQTTRVNTDRSEKAKLVFNRYGQQYFFAQAQMAGDSTTLAAVKSSAERVEEQTLASRRITRTIALVAH